MIVPLLILYQKVVVRIGFKKAEINPAKKDEDDLDDDWKSYFGCGVIEDLQAQFDDIKEDVENALGDVTEVIGDIKEAVDEVKDDILEALPEGLSEKLEDAMGMAEDACVEVGTKVPSERSKRSLPSEQGVRTPVGPPLGPFEHKHPYLASVFSYS